MTSDDDASSPARAQALFTPTLWANRSGSTTVRKVLHPARARDAAPAHHRSSWSSSSTSRRPPATPRASMLALPCSWRAPPRPLASRLPRSHASVARSSSSTLAHMCTIRTRSSLRATCIPTLPLVQLQGSRIVSSAPGYPHPYPYLASPPTLLLDPPLSRSPMRRRARGSDAHYVRIHSIPGRSAPASSLCRVYTLSISHSLTLARSLAPILALRISRPAPHKYLVRNSISTYIRIYRASESPARSPPPASDRVRCVATLHCPHQACSGAGRRHSMTTYATTPPPDAGQPLASFSDDDPACHLERCRRHPALVGAR